MHDPRFAGERRNATKGLTGRFAKAKEQTDAYKARVADYHQRMNDRVGATYDSRGAMHGRLDTLPLRDYATHANAGDTIRLRNQHPNPAATTRHDAFESGVAAALTTGRSLDDSATLVLRANPGAWEAHRAGNPFGSDDGGAAADACADAAFRIADMIQRRDPTITRTNALSAAWHEVQKTDMYQRMRAEQQLS